MGQTLCVSCGHPLAESVKFCGQCGATQPHVQVQVPHAPSSSPVNVGAQTVLQAVRPPMPAFPGQPPPATRSPGPSRQPVPTQLDQPLSLNTMVGVPSPLAPVAPAAPLAPASAPSAKAMMKTMMGMPASLGPETAASPPASPPPAAAPAFVPGAMNQTMLGVAMPGIAPTQPPSETAPPPPASSFQPPTAEPQGPPRRIGAPTLPLQVQYVPPPEPLREMAAPLPPRIVRKKGGFPLAAVALVTGAIVLAGGVTLAILWRGAPPITGQPRATADGKDILHLVCEPKSCKDGTLVALGGVPVRILDPNCVAKTFPDYWQRLERLYTTP